MSGRLASSLFPMLGSARASSSTFTISVRPAASASACGSTLEPALTAIASAVSPRSFATSECAFAVMSHLTASARCLSGNADWPSCNNNLPPWFRDCNAAPHISSVTMSAPCSEVMGGHHGSRARVSPSTPAMSAMMADSKRRTAELARRLAAWQLRASQRAAAVSLCSSADTSSSSAQGAWSRLWESLPPLASSRDPCASTASAASSVPFCSTSWKVVATAWMESSVATTSTVSGP
mmetsp:Transcript_7258/g.15713  ORF Transcript_7258/g.15713 Transcript_7258/m.15713 type:complete len:237 (-) Transcript_7258:906-1616(-)